MIRLFDFILSLFGLILFFPLFILIFIFGFLDKSIPFFIQKRVGLNLKNFTLIKFRTMKIGTLSAGTHLIDKSNITRFGFFFRKFKLDELPQLLNVFMGHMSLVGPRPCLPNQKRLIIERKKRGVYKVKPGITGLAQVSGINMSRPTLLAKTDLKMIKQMDLFYYFYYILKTVLLIFRKES
jgi:lipopolysaccharide/colanic/teichoic acid biosynthesis glycosyltransferase